LKSGKHHNCIIYFAAIAFLLPAMLARADEPPAKRPWQFGGFADVGYLRDFNDPANHLFRSRGTAFHVNELDLNMAGVYARKQATSSSRWGVEVTMHEGKDAEVFGFSATAPNLDGSKFLRHLGPTDVSYLAPVGKGLTLQGGIFSSLIGYDSLYAKDNFNYTRPWGADFTPYLMLGVNGSYPFTDRVTGTLFVVNGYWHLADANSVPSSGGQLAYKPTDRWTLKQTVLYGPHQADTSLEFWRFISDSIAEWKGDRLTTAFEYQIATEKIAGGRNQRALWTSVQLPVHWAVNAQWSATIRPEFAEDRDGRWTGSPQRVRALTSTVEYRIPHRATNTILRLEHRFDDSRGTGGGFFNGGFVQPGVVGLKPTQQLLILAAIFTFDSTRN
jgi:Putative beta-barrel porin-2, OmpL-like. bbp2